MMRGTEMIIQGSNAPVIIETDETLSGVKELSVALIQSGVVIKSWSKTDVKFIDNRMICPLTESETMSFDAGMVKIEVKWCDADGRIYQGRRIHTYVSARNDRREIAA